MTLSLREEPKCHPVAQEVSGLTPNWPLQAYSNPNKMTPNILVLTLCANAQTIPCGQCYSGYKTAAPTPCLANSSPRLLPHGLCGSVSAPSSQHLPREALTAVETTTLVVFSPPQDPPDGRSPSSSTKVPRSGPEQTYEYVSVTVAVINIIFKLPLLLVPCSKCSH